MEEAIAAKATRSGAIPLKPGVRSSALAGLRSRASWKLMRFHNREDLRTAISSATVSLERAELLANHKLPP
jgi:hypothetical protein